MKLLQEIINPNTVNLTNTQQAVLIIIRTSPTPEVAYEATNGQGQSVAARNSLRSLGLVKVGGNKAIVTANGAQALINYNLVDESGQITESGTDILNSYNKEFNKDTDQDSNVDVSITPSPERESLSSKF